jgi:hypothetical protein
VINAAHSCGEIREQAIGPREVGDGFEAERIAAERLGDEPRVLFASVSIALLAVALPHACDFHDAFAPFQELQCAG